MCILKVGDRVELVDHLRFLPTEAMRNGVVVLYRGKHSRTTPRVRWASGWGTSSPAGELRMQTREELLQTPPATIEGDL